MTTKVVRCTANALRLRLLPEVSAATDTGHRLIRDQQVLAVGESFDKKWLYVDGPAGDGWASALYLTDAPITAPDPIVTVDPAWPEVPHGKAEIIATFGQPGNRLCSSGRVHLPAPLKLSWSTELVEVIACHKLLEDVFASVFNQIFARARWNELENFGGIFNIRTITSSQKISTHAWGIAGDFDTLDNALGRKPQMDSLIIRIFKDHGFSWGGEWSRPDGMHFQYATGY